LYFAQKYDVEVIGVKKEGIRSPLFENYVFCVFFEKITNILQIFQAIYICIVAIINCDAFTSIILSWL